MVEFAYKPSPLRHVHRPTKQAQRRGEGLMTICLPCTPTREPTKHVYYGLTKSLCATCKRSVDAKIHFRDGQVWFDKFCPAHGHQQVLVASSVEWYLDALSFVAPAAPPRAST